MPVCCEEVSERKLYRPMLVQEMINNIKVINETFKVARERQKSYTDNHRKALEFDVAYKVFLKLSPWKGMIRFGRKGKLGLTIH